MSDEMRTLDRGDFGSRHGRQVGANRAKVGDGRVHVTTQGNEIDSKPSRLSSFLRLPHTDLHSLRVHD
jgi:hypothetical protein